MQFLEREADIRKTFRLGQDYYDTCARWNEYYATAPYRKFESGV